MATWLNGAVVVMALVLAGCTTSMGKRTESSDSSFIQKGRTTKTEVTERFGKPTSTAKDSNGREVLLWEYAIWQKNALMISELKESTRMAVTVDGKGKVVDVSYESSTPKK